MMVIEVTKFVGTKWFCRIDGDLNHIYSVDPKGYIVSSPNKTTDLIEPLQIYFESIKPVFESKLYKLLVGKINE